MVHKIIKIILLAFLFSLVIVEEQAFGQCPAVGTTFSVNVPAMPGQNAYFLQDAIRNAADELVAVGLVQDQNNNIQAYFAKLDKNGDYIGNPKLLTPDAMSREFLFDGVDQRSIFITEAFDANGMSNGYMLAVNANESLDFGGVHIMRLNTQGCVVWSQVLDDASNTGIVKCHGIHRNNVNDYIVVTTVADQFTEFFTIDGTGNNCGSTTLTPTLVNSMIRLSPGVFGTAKWAAVGRSAGGAFTTIILLDANFIELTLSTDDFIFDLDRAKNQVYDMAAVGSDIYMVGSFLNNVIDIGPHSAWLAKLSGVPGSYSTIGATNFNLQWVREIDFPDVIGIDQTDYGWDIEVKNDTIAIGGWTQQATLPTTSIKPWMLLFNQNGNLLKSKIFTETNTPGGMVSKVVNQPNAGFNIVGLKYEINNGNPSNVRAWLSKCDNNLVIGNCQCNVDQVFNISNLTNTGTSLEDVNTIPALCQKTPQQILCTDAPNTRQICYQPNQPTAPCTANFSFTTDPNCFIVNVSATVTGTAPFIYTWKNDCNGPVIGQGQNTSLTFAPFGGMATYPICLMVTDGAGNTCTIQKLVPINGQTPAIFCPPNITVNGTVGTTGNCTAISPSMIPTLIGFCQPVTQTYTLSLATTGTGMGNAGGLIFNSGVTNVVYKATDVLGQMASCSFTVTVNCPPVADFATLCGDDGSNVPHKIKAFGSYVYVVGQTVENGQTLATFSKYDPATGSLIWGFHLDSKSKINDFEYIMPAEVGNTYGGFLLVGHTEPFNSATDNQSFILQVLDNGISPLYNLVNSHLYNLTGRESLNRIVRHPNPTNAMFPFFTLGVRNYPKQGFPPPNGVDQTFIMNLGMDGAINFMTVYDYKLTAMPDGDDELHRTLFVRNNGNLVFGGNDVVGTFENKGVLVEVSKVNGAELNTYTYTTSTNDFFDIYDGLELPNNDMIIVGEYFSKNQGFMAYLKADFTPSDVRTFASLGRFSEIGRDAQNHVYTVGKVFSPDPNDPSLLAGRQVVHRGTYTANGFSSFTGWFLEDPTEDAWENGHLYVSPTKAKIYYADARRKASPLLPGMADFNVLIGQFDLNLTSDCRVPYIQLPSLLNWIRTADNTNFTVITPPTPVGVIVGSGLPYICRDFCQQCSVAVSFTFDQQICNKVNFTATPTGTGPFTYQWDFRCDGTIDATTANPMFVYSGGGSDNCVTVTDATGCQSIATFVVNIPPDLVPPVLNCPANTTLNTNPGQCCATQNTSATAADNCSIPIITYILSGATTGTNPNTCFNLGLTTIVAIATDLSGNTATCVYTVTVRDQEKPVIICPANQTKSAPACQAGAIFTFNLPTVTDNCPLPTPTIVTCNRQSGEFFPCGTTIITCTATDAGGNTATCTFSVTVNCLCGEVAGADIECTSNPNVFTFQVAVQNQTGATGVCTLNVTPTQANIQISGLSTSWNGNLGTVSGTITVTDNCFPVNFFNVVRLLCQCPNGPVSCDLPFTLDVPCCHQISVADAEICSKASQLLVPLSGCSALPDVQQVRWYVAYAPCPPIGDPAWGTPYQVTNGAVCHDLVLLPAYLTGDVCVYAQVQQGDCGGSCSLIYSNVANINLCAPITATITPKAYYCSTNVPSTVSFSVSYNPMGCTNSVEWFDQNNNSLGTSNTLNVSGLNFANAPIISQDACWREYEYRVVVNQPCGPKSYVTGIRIYDDNAGAGVLSLLTPDVNPPPFCPGEDAQIKYAPNCATKAPPATEPEWFWSISTVSAGGPYSPIPEAGSMNPLHVTNKQYMDTWYKVTKQNGVCPADEVSIFLDYYNQLVIGSFSATSLDPCWSSGLVLTQNIVPITGCATTVKWYRNGDLIHSQVITGSVATYNYINAALGGNYEGNYYAVVEENCCNQVLKSNVVTVPPPCKVVVTGPCFRCLNEEMPLTGTIINPPTTVSCTYQWYILNDMTNLYFLLPGQIYATLEANMANTTYRFEANCNGYIKTVDFYVKQCNSVGTNEAEQNAAFLHIAPNPTNGMLTVTLAQEAPRGTWIDLVDMTGRLIQTIRVADAALVQTLDLTHLSSGIYMIKLRLQDQVIGVAKVVKE